MHYRPDISATLSELCKVQINPGEVHVKMMDHLIKYVNTTKNLGIVYGRHDRDRADGPLVMYVDSDWAGDPDTLYSRGGYQALAWQGPEEWLHRGQREGDCSRRTLIDSDMSDFRHNSFS